MSTFTIFDGTTLDPDGNPTSSFTIDLIFNQGSDNTWSLNPNYPNDTALTHGESSGTWIWSWNTSANNDLTVFGSSPGHSWDFQGINMHLSPVDPLQNVQVGATGNCVSAVPGDSLGLQWKRVA